METYIFTDRYGGNYPDLDTICKGDCEGMGYVPVSETTEGYKEKWKAAEEKEPTADGYHFVKCNQCEGTGKSENQIDADN